MNLLLLTKYSSVYRNGSFCALNIKVRDILWCKLIGLFYVPSKLGQVDIDVFLVSTGA